tara:strand:- start:588 stop:701 length:114 start_codon:yes stop_codon:yes gene_type:complete
VCRTHIKRIVTNVPSDARFDVIAEEVESLLEEWWNSY